ncbi:unnamed protein product [Ectocarpus sp. CCAP 1310/34]|nr:unnamed protein product [Ectocarpus sp. CCAP 1310/34]
MVLRRPRAGAAAAAAAPCPGMPRAAVVAAAATALAMLATSTLPAEAFFTPPAVPPSSWKQQQDTVARTMMASFQSPTNAGVANSFSRNPAAIDASERGGARLRVERGQQRRFSSSLGRPLRSSPSDGGSDDPSSQGMSESEKLREKLETIASASGEGGGEDGLTQKEQEELDEMEEDRRVEAEVDRLEAAEKAKSMDAFRMSLDEDDDDEDNAEDEVYEEIIANMTKPLGITIEESTDKAKLVYITSVGDKAEAAGLQVGDVLTGVSAVFGDEVWSVNDKNIEEIRSLVRCRPEPYSLIRVERGHVSLEERCAPGFDEEDLSNCWQLPDDMIPGDGEECELNPDYQNLWAAVYEEEMDVLTGESAARAAGVGRGGVFGGGGGGGTPKKGNQGPPPKEKPGPGSFNGETFTGDSWDTSGPSF